MNGLRRWIRKRSNRSGVADKSKAGRAVLVRSPRRHGQRIHRAEIVLHQRSRLWAEPRTLRWDV